MIKSPYTVLRKSRQSINNLAQFCIASHAEKRLKFLDWRLPLSTVTL